MPMTWKADCLYGGTGVRKTTAIGQAAQYYWDRYKMKTRLLSMDGGGYEPLSSLVDAGIIIPFVPNLRDHPIEALDLVCQGYWPVDINNENSQLVATKPEAWKDIAMVAIEGLTSAGDMMMRHLQAKKAVLSQSPSYQWEDGSKTYSGGNMTYYGFIQDRLSEFVMKSHLMGCQHKVLWTALESKGEDDGVKVYGPAIAGKKATGKAGQWFGNTLHLEMLTWEESSEVTIPGKADKIKQINVKSKPLLYTAPHADPQTKLVFPAKTRAPFQLASTVPATFEPDLGLFYKFMDDLKGEGEVSTGSEIVKKPQIRRHTFKITVTDDGIGSGVGFMDPSAIGRRLGMMDLRNAGLDITSVKYLSTAKVDVVEGSGKLKR